MINRWSCCNVVQAIQYLSADYLPTHSQSPEGITQLVQNLAAYEFTKAEKLQVVNLAPTLPVELYVVRRYRIDFINAVDEKRTDCRGIGG